MTKTYQKELGFLKQRESQYGGALEYAADDIVKLRAACKRYYKAVKHAEQVFRDIADDIVTSSDDPDTEDDISETAKIAFKEAKKLSTLIKSVEGEK